jgi:hypothetical protein
MADLATFKTKRRIADFTAQVTVEEAHEDDLTITKHPVERGAPISDHAYKEPARLHLLVGWSNSGDGSGEQGDDFVRAVYARLLALQATREPFSVTTGKRMYSNMLFATLATTTTQETENALMISAALQEVIIVETQTVTVPPRDVQANPAQTADTENAGTKQAVPAKTANKTALKALATGG